MLRTVAFTTILSGALFLPTKGTAQSRIDAVLTGMDPCARAPQVDRTAWVRMRAFELRLDGGDIWIKAVARIKCKTSDSALLKGSAEADISTELRVAVDTCRVRASSVELSSFSGSYGGAINGASVILEPFLEGELNDWAERECKDLFDAGG